MQKHQRTCEWCARYDPSYPASLPPLHVSHHDSIHYSPYTTHQTLLAIPTIHSASHGIHYNHHTPYTIHHIYYTHHALHLPYTILLIHCTHYTPYRTHHTPYTILTPHPNICTISCTMQGVHQRQKRMGMCCLPRSTCWFGAAAARENEGDGTGWRWDR
jgi:hypothetical protein